MINLNYKEFTEGFITEDEINGYSVRIDAISEIMKRKETMLDWLDLETTISKAELEEIRILSEEIKESADLLIVVGIGGSYLGAKAVIKALNPYFKRKKPEVIFAGYNLSGKYLKELIEYMQSKSVYVNVISKSGTTMETNISFDLLLQEIKKNFPDDYKKRIIITTDKEKGFLRELVRKENFRSLIVPENIGGRFSVLSAVGLFPVACAGIEINELLRGIEEGKKDFEVAAKFAVIRDLFFRKNFFVEAFTIYEENLESFANWEQQLFAETQGKDKKGILPFCNLYTTNLHSIGQFLQEGKNFVFETVLEINNRQDFTISNPKISLEKLNEIVVSKVALAHLKGGTPSVILEILELNGKTLGELIYFFFLSATIGAYLLEVNPFDQPGVEEYKKLVKDEVEKIINN